MKNKQTGFSLIELVTVIILIGILAVNVLPKFSGSSSFEAHPYRAQLISALRLTQQRAMQYTAATYKNSNGDVVNICNQLVLAEVSGSEKARYGVPDRTDCTTLTFASAWQPDSTGLIVDNNHQVNFQIQGRSNPSQITFDQWGRPAADCAGGCVINVISSDETINIQIESEGFIYAK
ncbi:MAG: type II secretion system protein [Thalassotalea sp.]